MVALNNDEAAIIGDSIRAVLWLFFGKNMTKHGPWQATTTTTASTMGTHWKGFYFFLFSFISNHKFHILASTTIATATTTSHHIITTTHCSSRRQMLRVPYLWADAQETSFKVTFSYFWWRYELLNLNSNRKTKKFKIQDQWYSWPHHTSRPCRHITKRQRQLQLPLRGDFILFYFILLINLIYKMMMMIATTSPRLQKDDNGHHHSHHHLHHKTMLPRRTHRTTNNCHLWQQQQQWQPFSPQHHVTHDDDDHVATTPSDWRPRLPGRTE